VSDIPPASTLSRPWRLTAGVAAVFSVLLGLAMVAGHLGTRAEDPLQSPQLREMKAKLPLSPADELLKGEIRQLDLQLRGRYFRQLERTSSGVYLLIGGVAIFILASTRVRRLERQPPMPQPQVDGSPEAARAAAARWAVGAIGVAAGAGLFALSLGLRPALPERAADIDKLLEAGAAPAPVPSDAASPDELARNWPRFRGPEGGGVSSLTNLPARWDAKTGAGILWKTPMSSPGFNSPIIWGNRVFFSGGDASQREVICLDLKTGQLLWRQAVAAPSPAGNAAQGSEIPDSTGYAASTMATDGRRVYAIFANGDLAALDLEGKQLWSKNMGPFKNSYGHAISLATWRDRLLLQLDQGESDDGKSKLCALDGRTGQVVWQRARKVGASWASPIVIEAAGKAQVITLAAPWVAAYAAADGAELWRVECLGGEVTPSPVFAGGLVLAASPSEKLLAIRPDGQGDVTKSKVVWSAEDNVPDITSPVSNGELAFTISSPGLLTCYDAKDGKKQWEHDYEMDCHASPAVAGNRVYLFSQKGAAVVVEAAREFKEVFRTEMGDGFHASPAFAQGRMVLRGMTNIWCVGEAQ